MARCPDRVDPRAGRARCRAAASTALRERVSLPAVDQFFGLVKPLHGLQVVQVVEQQVGTLGDVGAHRARQREIDHELRLVAPAPAWRALRVIGDRGGRSRGEGLEPPFVGREVELRLLKDLLHQIGDEQRPRLISITGPAGIGKSLAYLVPAGLFALMTGERESATFWRTTLNN